MIIQPSSVVISREAAEITGDFNPAFPICNDLEYWFRALRRGVGFVFSGQETTLYRKHRDAMSNNSSRLIAETGRVHFLHRKWDQIPFSQRRREIRRHYFNAARINRRAKPRTALTQFLASLVLPWI